MKIDHLARDLLIHSRRIQVQLNKRKRRTEQMKLAGLDFETAVVTNAERFSNGAHELATANGVKLIARKELKRMIEERRLINTY